MELMARRERWTSRGCQGQEGHEREEGIRVKVGEDEHEENKNFFEIFRQGKSTDGRPVGEFGSAYLYHYMSAKICSSIAEFSVVGCIGSQQSCLSRTT